MPHAALPHRQKLASLTAALRELHRTLVTVEQARYEKEWGRIDDPGLLLQLLVKHPQFAWLHTLSEMMADIDALTEQDEVSEITVRTAFDQAERMLSRPGSEETAFSGHYLAALHDSPAVTLAHAHVQSVLRQRDAST